MSRRGDYVRSLVRGLAEGASKRLSDPIARLRSRAREAIAQASSISERRITRALARVEGVREASAACRGDGIWIDAALDDGQGIQLCVTPLEARFAPRGAKELLFRVEPPELAARAAVRDLIGAIAALVAHTLWSAVLTRHDARYDAIAEREGEGELVRVDLRTVPAVRTAEQRGLGQFFDMLELSQIRVDGGALRLALKLPSLLGP